MRARRELRSEFKSKHHSRRSYTSNVVNGNIRLEGKKLRLPKVGMVRIIRQIHDYAEELEIVEENLFRKVKVDSKKMFRNVRRKKDCTQVYTKDEAILIYQEAWNDFRNSKRLVYRLAPLAVMFQFQTGLRIGELCAVKFEDVENGVLNVVRMLQRDSDKVVEHTKSHEDREVLLTDAALELIEVAREYQEEHDCKSEFIFSITEDALS